MEGGRYKDGGCGEWYIGGVVVVDGVVLESKALPSVGLGGGTLERKWEEVRRHRTRVGAPT